MYIASKMDATNAEENARKWQSMIIVLTAFRSQIGEVQSDDPDGLANAAQAMNEVIESLQEAIDDINRGLDQFEERFELEYGAS